MGFFDELSKAVNDIFNDSESKVTFNPSWKAGPSTPPPVAPPPTTPARRADQLYSDKLEKLIDMALADGILTDKERQLLFRKAQEEGVDVDEFEMVLESRLYQRQTELLRETNNKVSAIPPTPTPPATPSAPRMSGYSTPPPTPATLPKSTKHGDLHKCPKCGQAVSAFVAFCPGCGYEFSNVEAVNSIERLNRKLGELKSANFWDDIDERRAQCIATFPVPNTKADLYEFIITSSNNIIGDDHNSNERRAWRNKCHQCWDKARILLRDDRTSLEQIQGLLLEKGLLKWETKGLFSKERTGRLLWID